MYIVVLRAYPVRGVHTFNATPPERLQPELDQLHQICSIIIIITITITITPPNFSITLQLQLLCAKNRKLQL